MTAALGLFQVRSKTENEIITTCTQTHVSGPRLNQSNFRVESEQSGHPNEVVLYRKLVRSSANVLIKTSGSRALQWSGSLHVQLIRRHEIANSWPLNAVYPRHEVSQTLFLSLCLLILKGNIREAFACLGVLGAGSLYKEYEAADVVQRGTIA